MGAGGVVGVLKTSISDALRVRPSLGPVEWESRERSGLGKETWTPSMV